MDTTRTLREASARHSREGLLMKMLRSMRRRPWLTTAVGSALVAFLLLAVPISYTRTTGYDVRLDIASNDLQQDQVQVIAQKLQDIVQSESFWLSLDENSQRFHVSTRVAGRGVPNLVAIVDAFAQNLRDRGVPTEANVQPIIEKITNNMVAYAADQVREIRIDAEGKSLAEIEEEIRMRLEEEGFLNPSVTVTETGGEMQIDISGELPDDTEGSTDGSTQLNISVEGTLGESGESMSIGAEARAQMTDNEIREELTRQLKEQGVDAEVVVKDGEVVSVKRR
jgi:hypothetical protein